MNSLGIYFGPKIISLVETKGKKLINKTQFIHSIMSSAELEEKATPETKIIEIIALFKEELRRNKIAAKEAALCLSGRDLIIRTFEIPVLPREELQGAINFEARKYIPFKVEDLISDFQLKFDKSNRTNLVLFIGIKKETLDRYVSILSQLDIKINAIEYSAFSILRNLKLCGINFNGIIGILSADLHEKDEVNFIVLENGFPLFSRDIAMSEGPVGLGKPEAAEPTQAIEKLKAEMRVSLDYYHRKFPGKNIKKTFIILNQDYHPDLEAFLKDIGLSANFIDVAKQIDKEFPYSLNFIKAYSSSLAKKMRINLTVNLLAVRERARVLQEKIAGGKETVSWFKFLKFDYGFVILALFICIAIYGLGFYRAKTLSRELDNVLSARKPITIANPKVTLGELTGKHSEYKTKIDNLARLVKKQLYLTIPLNLIPQAIPEGVWLNSIGFNKVAEDKAEFILEGMSSFNNADKEFDAINKFLSNLKEDPEFNKYFSEINIVSLDRRERDKLTVTNFSITCKSYKD